MIEHIHKWEFLSGTNLICNGKDCKLVTSLVDLIENTAIEAALRSKIKVYSDLLMSRELKKDAHTRVYAWVMANASADKLPIALKNNQERLL